MAPLIWSLPGSFQTLTSGETQSKLGLRLGFYDDHTRTRVSGVSPGGECLFGPLHSLSSDLGHDVAILAPGSRRGKKQTNKKVK